MSTAPVPKRVEVGESSAGGVFGFLFFGGHATATDSCGTDQGHRKTKSIHMFPDSVLLEIFDLCRTHRKSHYSKKPAPIFEWRLAHVCQRWRYLILALPSRLDLELHCSAGMPVRKGLGCWPAFPIIVEYNKVAPKIEIISLQLLSTQIVYAVSPSVV